MLSMEAILILTELQTPFARSELRRAATQFQLDERRQAAIWGLGKSGLKSYGDLVPFISDQDENVAYHAIIAFGHDTPRPVIDQLLQLLTTGEPRLAAAASETLRLIGSTEVIRAIAQAIDQRADDADWLLATLGRLPPNLVREHMRGTAVLDRLRPMLLVAPDANWLSTENAISNVAFLVKQNL